ncbi:MAG: DUF4177 domain-containing protein [Saprospiraceae bacterium]|nr:DUF4177 domain-containing protein [Saprospiraceae bacterium]
MERIKYKTHTINLKNSIFSKRKIDGETLTSELNKLGEQGWELVTKVDSLTNGWTNNVVLIFKRKR